MKRFVLLMSVLALANAGCSKKSDSSKDSSPAVVSAEKPTAVIDALSAQSVLVGTGVGLGITGNASRFAGVQPRSAPIADTSCSEGMGYPVAIDTSGNTVEPVSAACSEGTYMTDDNGDHHYCAMPSTHESYPGMRAYCILARTASSETTVQGAFAGFKMISCAIEKAGITWHETGYTGAADTVTMTISSECFSEKMIANSCSGQPSCDVDVSVKAIRAPSDYYDASIDIIAGDSYYHAKVKSSDNIYEVAMANNGSGQYPEQDDTYVAKYNSTDKSFTFEARADRISIGTPNNPFSLHIRMYAEMSADGFPKKAEAAISELSDSGSSFTTRLTTVKGAFGADGTGLAGEFYTKSNATLATAITISGTAASVSKCYPGDGPPVALGTAGCEDGALTVPSGALAFTLPGSTYRVTTADTSGKYQASLDWFNALAGLDFTTVSIASAD